MLDINEFSKKQIVMYFPAAGDKIFYQNDNMIIRDNNKRVKYQLSCYRIFMIIVVGDTSITTGLLKRARKFGISICLMSFNFKLYMVIGSEVQGNTMLHKKQYDYEGMEIARHLIINKVQNQRQILMKMRAKTEDIKEAIALLDKYVVQLQEKDMTRTEIIGMEGTASKVYFPRIFNNVKWMGRKPRIKFDYVNVLLDIGYTLLFNFIDAILQVFGFDVYYGVLHTCFYMRKSLVCDIMEPFRPIIDWQIRKSINLGQFNEKDFVFSQNRWTLNYKKSAQYSQVFLEAILERKEEIFLYIRTYYRCVMKGKPITEYPVFIVEEL